MMIKDFWTRRKAVLRWVMIEIKRDRVFRFTALSIAGILAAPTIIAIALATGDFKIPYLVASLLAGLFSWLWLMDLLQRQLRKDGHPKLRATFIASIAVAAVIFAIGLMISMAIPGLKFPISIFGLYSYINSIL